MRVPQQVEGWKAVAPQQTYNGKALYKYIDGAAEVYLAYGFQRVLARQYAKAGEKQIVLDVFDMGSAADAFGVFTFEREGPDIAIGQGSEYAAGLLRFWKGPYFVSILADRETAASKKAVFALAKAVADAMPQTGPEPALVSLVPPDGLQRERLLYLHTHGSLSFHYFVADDNILKLGKDTDAVLATYGSGAKRHRLLLVRYPREDRAKEALTRFLRSYLPDAGRDGAARVEDGGWCAARRYASHVMVVFDAPEKSVATDLLAATESRLRKVQKK